MHPLCEFSQWFSWSCSNLRPIRQLGVWGTSPGKDFQFKAAPSLPPPPPVEAILVIFGRRALIFFCLKALGKIWKMTPLLCACAVVITLESQKCWKRAPRSVEFNFFIYCDRRKLPVDLSAIQNIGSCETIWNLVFDNPAGNIKIQNVVFRPSCFLCFLGMLMS